MLSGWLATSIEDIVAATHGRRKVEATPLDEIPDWVPPSVRSLLEDGSYIDERDPETGNTALHNACEYGDENLVALLLQHGADPAMPTRLSRVNAVHIAARHGRSRVIETIRDWLENRRQGGPQIYGRHEDEERQSEKWLLLIQSTSVDGRSPLHLASAAPEPSAQTVQLFVDALSRMPARGLSLVNCQDVQGRTPLYLAAKAGQLGAVNRLLDAGASIETADVKGRTPLRATANQNIFDILITRRGLKSKGHKSRKAPAYTQRFNCLLSTTVEVRHKSNLQLSYWDWLKEDPDLVMVKVKKK